MRGLRPERPPESNFYTGTVPPSWRHDADGPAVSVDTQGLMWCDWNGERRTRGELWRSVLAGDASDRHQQLQPAVSCSSPVDSVRRLGLVSIKHHFRVIWRWRISRPWRVTKGHWWCHHSIDRIVSIRLHCNCGPILYRFRAKARYCSKIAIWIEIDFWIELKLIFIPPSA